MSEKENVKEVKNEKTTVINNTDTNVDVENNSVEILAGENDAFGDVNNSGSNNGTETIYDVPMNLQRQKGNLVDGVQYYRYAVSVNIKFNGSVIPFRFFCDISGRSKTLALISNAIYGEADSIPVQIVKTTSTRTVGKKTVVNTRYSMRIKSSDENNLELTCPFSPSAEGDRAIFLNVVECFKKAGKLG